MTGYNGHRNWNHWNVSLWINNDEGLYRQARELVRRHGKEEGAVQLVELLEELGMRETPDGAPYTKTSVRAALRDF